VSRPYLDSENNLELAAADELEGFICSLHHLINEKEIHLSISLSKSAGLDWSQYFFSWCGSGATRCGESVLAGL
jgi:hypothetical protein